MLAHQISLCVLNTYAYGSDLFRAYHASSHMTAEVKAHCKHELDK